MRRRGRKNVISFPGNPRPVRASNQAAKIIVLPVIRIETVGWVRQEREKVTRRP